jgi:hypothetical protein
VALVVFVCLTVASVAVTIVLFTKQEELKATAQDSANKRRQAAQQHQDLQRHLSDIALHVIGDPIDQPAEIKQRINTALTSILQDELVTKANIPADAAVLTVLRDLYETWLSDVDALETMTDERDRLSRELKQQTEIARTAAADFDAKRSELETRFQQLEQQSKTHQEAWDKQVTELKEQLAGAEAAASKQLDTEREKSRQQAEKLAEQQARLDELVARLAEFRPSAERLSLLQLKDGTVVDAVAGEDIVYIDLGRANGIKPGMTFAVYSAVRGIPPDGKGKASVKVINVFETASECLATTTTEGDPVLPGDIVANPVYDRSRRLAFAVAGDFDLDFDGKIDDPGGERVMQIIESAGSRVVDKIDTRTDFIVLGTEPPGVVADEAAGGADVQAFSAKLQAARKAFESARAEARALSIPVLTRTQFLHFIGFGVPRHVHDDEPAAIQTASR